MKSIRRSFVDLLSTGAVILAACAPAAQPAAAPAPAIPPAPAAKPAPAAPAAAPEKQPKYGGILTAYNNNEMDAASVDPFMLGGQNANTYGGSFYDGLIRFDFTDTSRIIPELAERWEVSPDGRTYTFYLRKDVKWQDGKPFGAWDVQFTYDRILDKSQLVNSSFGKTMVEFVDSWETVDDYTFKIKLKYPVIYLAHFLASNHSVIGPKHMFDKERGTVVPQKHDGEFPWGVGTGPFRLVKLEEGSSVEFVKNPNFFRKGLPYLDGWKRLTIKDRATQVAGLASGRIMVGEIWPANVPSEIKLIQGQAGDKMRIVYAHQNAPQQIAIQPGFPPMDNPKVRRAVFLAIDRWEISERVFEGTGEAGTYLDTRLYGDWALPKEEAYKLPGLRKDKAADIAEAKRLLAEAGYPNGFEAIWQVRNAAEYIPTATVAATELAKIGIKSKIESLDTAAGQRIIQQGKWHLGATGGNNPAIHALRTFYNLHSLAKPTYANFNVDWVDSNKAFVDMYNKAVTSLDPTEAKKLTWDMQRYLLTVDARAFPVVWIDSPIVVWNYVKNYYPPVHGMTEGHDFTIAWLDQ